MKLNYSKNVNDQINQVTKNMDQIFGLFTTVQKRLGQGLPKRAHQVRGHYRTQRYGVRLPVEQWIWVPTHQRGDANLGFIHKDYHVELADEDVE